MTNSMIDIKNYYDITGYSFVYAAGAGYFKYSKIQAN
jgi:hypothetical protein